MKRIYLSIWCGVVIPFLYFLLLVLLDALDGNKIGEPYRRVLLMPLTWPGKVYSYFFESSVVSVGDAFGFAAGLFAVSFFGNIILYALLAYVVLWYRARQPRLP